MVRSVVLITTATNPPDGVCVLEMSNVAKRNIAAKAAVLFWAMIGVEKIVLADATGQTLLDEADAGRLAQMGVELEQINYQQDNDMVVRLGKGFGEGALIRFAVENSEILRKSTHFFKCTGKVFCRNFPEILRMIEENNIQNMFWKLNFEESHLDTRFFYASRTFFEKYLLSAYSKINDREGVYSEHTVFAVANDHLTKANGIRPKLTGFSGSTDTLYHDESFGFYDNHFPCWIS